MCHLTHTQFFASIIITLRVSAHRQSSSFGKRFGQEWNIGSNLPQPRNGVALNTVSLDTEGDAAHGLACLKTLPFPILFQVQMHRSLHNVSIRIVGTYLRVNYPANPSSAPPSRYKSSIALPELDHVEDGPDGHPTVGTVMEALMSRLPREGYELRMSDLPGGRKLDSVSFGPTGSNEPFFLSASETTAQMAGSTSYCPSGRRIIASWQYHLLSHLGGPAIPMSGRTSYHTSPPVRDGMAIIWRLIIAHGSVMSESLQARRKLMTA